jgi:hypothetical protein
MLIDCGECGGQVSDRAASCPHCGISIRIQPVEPAELVKSELRSKFAGGCAGGCATIIVFIGVVLGFSLILQACNR